MSTLTEISRQRSFGGWHAQYAYDSEALNSRTRFAIFLPPGASQANPVPVLYWLSGLTCTDENFMQKAAAQRVAAELGLAIVAPDTSPRGEDVADNHDYDLGQGAGFYLNATEPPWQAHYQMERFVTEELPARIEAHFPVTDRRAIAGHSMGGHGALVLSLRHPGRYRSVSAFSPITHPVAVPWGQKAFSAYLGADRDRWQQYDAACLMRKATPDQHCPTLVSQGLADEFLNSQLQPWHLTEAAGHSGYPLTLEQHPDYDHSYYFIASFIEQHLRFHQEVLSA